MNDTPVLSERAQILLKTLIEKYIADGQPVGSKSLVHEAGLEVSSATIRHVLSDLEDMGLIRSPHKSAGRVPTDLGYRLFVDSMVTVKPVKRPEINRMKQHLEIQHSPKELALSASDLLSGITGMASIVMLPRRPQNALRHIEFLPLSNNRVLTILVLNECEVENRVIQTNREFSASELEQIANFLNHQFIGQNILTLREKLLHELDQARLEMNTLMQSLLEMADQIFPEQSVGDEYLVAGKSNLFAYQEMANTDKLRQLFDTFKSKKDVLEILDQCLIAQGMQIFIGSETGNDVMDQCSIITSPYTVDGDVIGVLGVIGPTRMAYQKVIPIVDITAKLFGSALEFKQ